MKKLFSFFNIVLFVIVILAGFLRMYGLDSYPAGFHIDEASLGYNGYSMLKTGKDEYGNTLPLYIDMFGDNRPSGYHYLTIAPIAVFGLNEFSTRLPGALFGTMSVVALYYLALYIFKDKKIALITSLLMSISPWSIVSSRASSEATVSLFFILTGIAIILMCLRTKKVRPLLLGFISLALSFFFYHTARVFVPLLLASIIILFYKHRKAYNKTFQFTGLFLSLSVAIISFLLIFAVKGGTGRFRQVSIFGTPQTTLIMEEQFREDGTRNINPIVSRIFHNKYINYATTFTSNYFDYLSGSFLFMKGGRPLWYKIPNIGMIYIIELPFIVIGFIYLFMHSNNLLKFSLAWLFIAPVVASLTTDDIPNIQRSLVMFPMIELLAGYGLIRVLEVIQNKQRYSIILFVFVGFLFNIVFFLHQYFIHGSSHETIYRFNGFKEMVLAVKDVYSQYDYIVVTKTSGGIYPHVLFFMEYDPFMYQAEGSPKDKDFGGFGKFIFTPEFCPSINGSDRFPAAGRFLYVNSGTCVISPLLKQKKIYREDGTLAFIIVYPQN